MKPDVVIVGAGLTGATFARVFADEGLKPLVVERRSVVGGNCRDVRHKSGILYNVHGPHYFRTNSERVWTFANRFAHFRNWHAEVATRIDGKLTPWPLQAKTVNEYAGGLFTGTPTNFEQAMLAQLPKQLYEKAVEGYTRKQWGVEPKTLSTCLAGRIEIRTDPHERRLKLHKWQGLPNGGYTNWIREMLDGINVECERDGWSRVLRVPRAVWTGSIDEFFGYRLGRLRYRTQKRDHVWRGDVDGFEQPCVQVNLPSMKSRSIRVIEWKHMMPPHQQPTGTLLTWEYPVDAEVSDENEYPFPDAANAALYLRYLELAEREVPHVTFAGRLGRYKYLDMDQAIGAALKTAQALLMEMKVAA